MNQLGGYSTVAKAVRVEYHPETHQMYLVFQILDPQLQQQIQQDWNKDIPFILIGKDLVRK